MSIKPPKLIRTSPIRTFFSLMLLCLSVPRILGQETTWEIVAGISASDRISIIHVNNLLSSKGIDHIIEGSVVYGISVHPPYARQVERLLRKDAKKHGYHILFGKDDYLEAKKGRVRQIGKPITALLAEREFAADTALGKLLRSDTL